MTRDGNAAPKKGREKMLKRELISELEQRDRKEAANKEASEFIRVGLIVISVMVVIIVAGFVVSLLRGSSGPIEDAMVSKDVETNFDVDSEPMWPAGVHSWTQWEDVATSEMREALLEMVGVSPEDTRKWAADEMVLGKSFQTEVDPGTIISNSGINDAGWYRVNRYVVKEGDTLFLTTDKGIIAVKVSCGNPVSPVSPTSAKGTNPYPNSIGDHQRATPVPPATPGYVPSTAERVTEEQNTAPIGGLDPTPSGTPGTGSGGVTPPAETEQPDGTVVLTPPTPSEPPAPPPPLAEVPPGTMPPEPD